MEKGYWAETRRIKAGAEPIDDITKFAWADDDYECVREWVGYSEAELAEMAEQEEARAEAVAADAVAGQVRAAAMLFVASLDLDDESAMGVNALCPEWGAGVDYAARAVVRHGRGLYRCLQAHASQTGWEPPLVPALWSRVDVAADGTERWTQPTGAHDAYAEGAVVLHGGERWRSAIGANVWEPGVHGWEKAGVGE